MDVAKFIRKYPKVMDKKTNKIIKQIEKNIRINILQLHNKTKVSYRECHRIVNRLVRKGVLTRSQKKRARGSPVFLRLKKK